MAYTVFEDTSLDFGSLNHSSETLQITGNSVDLPDASFVRDADITRDGMDLVLQGPDGTVVIEGYFAAEPAPNLVAPDGSTLTPELVESFAKSGNEYASNETGVDVSPVGGVQEVTGEATVTRADGSVETIQVGTPIYQGDIIETTGDGAVNIMFIDETSFAVSEDARLAIDEYVFDPATNAGTTNFSVLKGVFVFTSGLIGRADPDDVHIDTPAGSIGIRGTIIAGNVTTGQITVVEGAIVLTDLMGNQVTLASQFETARFGLNGQAVENVGQLAANDVIATFSTLSSVSPNLFSSLNDAAGERHDNSSQNNNNDGDNGETGDGNNDGDNAGDNNNGNDDTTNGDDGFGDGDTGFGDDNGGLGDGDDPGDGDDTRGNDDGDNGDDGDNAGGDDGRSDGDNGDGGNGDGDLTDPNAFNNPGDDRGEAPIVNDSDLQRLNDPGNDLNFFSSTDGDNWSFDFGAISSDPDGPDAGLQFGLGDNTMDILNLMGASGSFDANGLLQLDFSGVDFGDLATTHYSDLVDLGVTFDGGQLTFSLSINVTDADGNITTLTYDFEYLMTTNEFSAAPSPLGGTGAEVWVEDANDLASNLTIAGDNKTVFLNNDDNTGDTVVINGGNDNTIYMGDLAAAGSNTIQLNGTASNNTIFGGGGREEVSINGAGTGNEIYTMDGDDLVTVDMSAGASMATLDSGVIDMGGGDNDTLSFTGVGGTIDFTTISDNIHNVEVLDFYQNGAALASNGQTITLSDTDVMNMTDGDNSLIIELGTGDTLNLSGFTDMGPQGDYEFVFVNDQGVTLYIDTNGTNAAVNA